jgi:peptidoglycan/LPS O-acetylase OafA/YrhL
MKRIVILEGLRGWLACWVMISHILLYLAVSSRDVTDPFLHYLAHIPEMGRTPVWLFMILSGFINFYLMDSRQEAAHVYLARRFLRLWPVFALLFAVSVPLNYWNLQTLSGVSWAEDPWIKVQYRVTNTAFDHLWPNVIVSATLLHGFVPRWAWPDCTSAFLGVAWSIGTEWQFYLLVPALFWWARQKWSLLWMGVLALLCYFGNGIDFIQAFQNGNPSLIVFNFHLFFVGIVSYRLYRQFVLKKTEGALSRVELIVLGFLIAYLSAWDLSILLWAALFLLTVLFEQHPGDKGIARLGWLFSNRLAQYLGTISYSIYLSHWLMLMVVVGTVYRIDPQITPLEAAPWVFPGVIVMTFLVSHFLYRWVENPCIRYGKRLFNET